MATQQQATVTVQGDREILITREFDAPAALVWRAWTTPELVRQWWHARRGEVTSIEIDLRVGGAWRYVMVTPDGMEVALHGAYREIVPHERLVATEVYEGMPDGEAVTTLTLREQDGRTHLQVHVEHACREHRDAHIASGMEAGLQDALVLLEETARSLG